MPSQIVIECSKQVAKKGLKLAFAESVTAGRLASEFALTADSGKVLPGGLICYDACLKEDILGVPKYLIEKYTPESPEVTEELAKRIKNLIQSDIQVAVTGLTTAGGSETPDKPVGTIFIHTIIEGKSIALRKVFKGSPENISLKSIDSVAQLILSCIEYKTELVESTHPAK